MGFNVTSSFNGISSSFNFYKILGRPSTIGNNLKFPYID